MNKYRVEVYNKFPITSLDALSEQIEHMAQTGPLKAKQVHYYLLECKESIDSNILHEVFCDDVSQEFHLTSFEEDFDYSAVVDISFRAGVTDNVAHSAKDALALFGKDVEVASGSYYLFQGDVTLEKLQTAAGVILGNNLIQQINVFSKDEFSSLKRFESIKLPRVVLNESLEVEKCSLELSDDELEKLSVQKCLALTVNELKFLRNHYKEPAVNQVREKMGLPVDQPTDVELEVIAQSWSEHCKHKIFSANIQYNEKNLSPDMKKLGAKNVESLYKSTIKASTKNIEKNRKLPWLVSVFSDNAGIVDFDDQVNLCIKVETHNSPSALDPYGGALTGILGVNRDILGVGLGARPIANTDVFCFAPPAFSEKQYDSYLPYNLLPSKRIFEGVHLGVEDGGNKSGIPTVNGAIYFDRDFAGKPLVFVGTVGVLPKKIRFNEQDRATEEKLPEVGDRIYMVGGAIGADGIHGATFSSLELDENSPATAVQIGDPLTQKRVSDFLLEARDKGLYSSVTDNGAGGLSSSVGEMATMTNGAEIDLELCPTKYPGLKPYELMISESQERMTVAVPQKYVAEFEQLALSRGVSATNIGSFTDTGYLSVNYGEKLVAYLDLHFLHDALPSMQLEAEFEGAKERNSWVPETSKKNLSSDLSDDELNEVLATLLASPNIASKEKWVRRYDHEVQAATVVKPFVGKTGQGPSNSGVVWLYPHGGQKNNAVSIGMGMNPRVSQYDTYTMAQYSVDEAVRNVVATGGDIDTTCLLDNFCWPDPVVSHKNPDGKHKLAQLVRACFGLQEIVEAYGTPLVSGKDSMKNDYRGKNKKGEDLTISILPTLMVTAMAKNNVERLLTSDFKQSGDLIYLLGNESRGLLYSEFAERYSLASEYDQNIEEVDIPSNLKLYRELYAANQQGLISSCHDLSDGGLMVALAEAGFGNDLGWNVDASKLGSDNKQRVAALYTEAPGRFIVSIEPENKAEFEKSISNSTFLGEVVESENMHLKLDNERVVEFSGSQLKQTWVGSL